MSTIGVLYAFYSLKPEPVGKSPTEFLLKTASWWYLMIATRDVINSLIINKRYERQADEFAYKVMGKGEGLISFFEKLIKKDADGQNQYDNTYQILSENGPHYGILDKLDLWSRYYLSKLSNAINNSQKWVYYNTPFGPHPSPESRIEVAQEYLNSCEELTIQENS